jgi:hypothetical protein
LVEVVDRDGDGDIVAVSRGELELLSGSDGGFVEAVPLRLEDARLGDPSLRVHNELE